ncbi:PREDICTED: HBS1-like protein [Ceratosolen solmsi marchali]|uniref:HBS1-like protein n=1 Tax=Ceratosolen solmsi marchali TaxID=326594 RepID=A0AAJ6YCM5_9HYME|nr:PREDICTED: HBS1-like protein [Ceratosolen solmsi marchali]
MSRHRDVRSMEYSNYIDTYDDLSEDSMEEDYAVSPSVQQFIYDRNKEGAITSFFNHLDNEDNKVVCDVVYDEAALKICRDAIGDLLVDIISESELKKRIYKFNYNVEAVINSVLNEPNEGLRSYNLSDFIAGNNPSPEELPEKMKPTVKVVPTTSKNIVKGFDVSVTENVNNLTIQSESPCVVRNQELKSKADSNRKKKGQASTVNLLQMLWYCTIKGKLRSELPITLENSEQPRVKEKRDALAIYKSKRESCKENLSLIMVGHVDAGKSTILGRLLYDLGQVPDKVFHKNQEESKKIGKQSFVYAWVLDLSEEERERGITMDIGQSKFETDNKIITLIDSPGHKDFVPNVIMGVAQADVAFLVVDATTGEFETGFESGGQTREHTLLLRALGVTQLAVIINKLDTVNWSEQRFKKIVMDMADYLKQVGFKEPIRYVPCSGLSGVNIVENVKDIEKFSWYNGPTLVEVIDGFKSPERPVDKPLRFSVNDIFKNAGFGFSIYGHMETGMVSVGDKILVLPSNETAIVKGIQMDDNNVTHAFAGDQVSLILANNYQEKLAIGHIICDPQFPVPVTNRFQAHIACFNINKILTIGMPVVLHQQSLVEPAIISRIMAEINKSTGEPLKKAPRYLAKNMNAIVQITTERPICVELQKDSRQIGRITLRIDGLTIAAGLITKIE